MAYERKITVPLLAVSVSIVILVAVFGVFVWYNIRPDELVTQGPYKARMVTSPDAPEQMTNLLYVTGVLRDSGLSQEEQERLGIPARYQVTDFDSSSFGPRDGFFLLTTADSTNISGELLGRCVTVAGTMMPTEAGTNFSDTYNRGQLQINSITETDQLNCSPYQKLAPATEPRVTGSYAGYLRHNPRPAADVGYDYQLELAEPINDVDGAFGASGLPQQVSRITVMPADNTIWRTLQPLLADSPPTVVTAQGYWEWGYAESRVFHIEKLTVQGR